MANKKFTEKQVEDALRATGGFITYAAKQLGCHYVTVLQYLKNSEYLRKVRHEIDMSYLDLTEVELIKKVKSGDLGAICFYLKCKGKNRGYVERYEHGGVDGEAIKITVTKE